MPEPTVELTVEERFLWHCARTWRDPTRPEGMGDMDWRRTVAVGLKNRLPSLLAGFLRNMGLTARLPDEAAKDLEKGQLRLERMAGHLGRDLRRYLQHAAALGQEVIVLKGLWLSQEVYGDLAMRPGSDIDVLLRERDIPDSLAILEEKMGYGRWWRPLLDDRYYQRHHLHQQRCNHDRSIWFEPHWMLDHPFSLLTVDYEALMDRAQPGTFLGQPVRVMPPADLLLSLAIHLVKHAVYLPATVSRPDLPRLILADGLLLYFLDIAEAIKKYQEMIVWPDLVERANDTGAVNLLAAALRACHLYLDAPVPAPVLEELSPTRPGFVTRTVMKQLANHEIAEHLGQPTGAFWSFLLGYNESLVFRPVRLLDLARFCIPGRDYLRRRYGRANVITASLHLVRVLYRYLRVGVDTIVFTWQRSRRIRKLDQEGFPWPGPPPDVV